MDPPAGYDIVTAIGPDADPAELERAGATWAIDGPATPGEPFETTRKRIAAGPPGR
jgi:hypothetical protein